MESRPFKDSGYSSYYAPSESTASVLPASQYLQDRLSERRSRNTTRPKRSRQSDVGPPRSRTDDDDIFLAEAEESRASNTRLYDSSPVTGGGTFTRSRAGSSDVNRPTRARRQMGLKETAEAMDKLAKENFDLKMHLRHSRDHVAKLQTELEEFREGAERREKIEEEHAELLRINSLMIGELEKRDRAVEEAMDMICDLEEKLTLIGGNGGRGEGNGATTRPSTAQADSGYAGTEMQEVEMPSSPPEIAKTPQVGGKALTQPLNVQGVVENMTPARPKREPSFLSQKKPSTHALRSVYMENAKVLQSVKSFNSLISKREGRVDGDHDDPDSPRLSALSESSFPSIYSPRKGHSPEGYTWEANEDEEEEVEEQPSQSSHARDLSINRVNRWIAERDAVECTPSKSNNISSPLIADDDKTERGNSPSPLRNHQTQTQTREHEHKHNNYHSLNNAVAPNLAPAQTVAPANSKHHAHELHNSLLQRTSRSQKKNHSPTSLVGPIFPKSKNDDPLLPPTPDSASTRMLRASRSSIADDRSLLDTTPATVRGYDVLQPKQEMITASRQQRRKPIGEGDADTEEGRAEYSSSTSSQSSISKEGEEAGSSPDTANVSSDEEDNSDGEDDSDDADSEHPRRRRKHKDYPDGNSIFHGTPSRFQQRLPESKEPPNLFDHAAISPPLPPAIAQNLRHRQSSSDASTLSPVLSPSVPGRQSPHRADTSSRPASHDTNGSKNNTTGFFNALGMMVSPSAKNPDDTTSYGDVRVRSPTAGTPGIEGYSWHSDSNSSIGTVIPPPPQQQQTPLPRDESTSSWTPRFSPGKNGARTPQTQTPTQAGSASTPRMTLGQRTQMLIRRMSNSQSGSPGSSQTHAQPQAQMQSPAQQSQQQPPKRPNTAQSFHSGSGKGKLPTAGGPQHIRPSSSSSSSTAFASTSVSAKPDTLAQNPTQKPVAARLAHAVVGDKKDARRPSLTARAQTSPPSSQTHQQVRSPSATVERGDGGTTTLALREREREKEKDSGRRNPLKRGGSVRDAGAASTEAGSSGFVSTGAASAGGVGGFGVARRGSSRGSAGGTGRGEARKVWRP
ncbi:hypothetical protein MBLNU230_g5336t1 [Neophaeotheca triangularis]